MGKYFKEEREESKGSQASKRQEELGVYLTDCQPEPIEPLHDWIPLTTIEEMEKTHYDVIVVGSGAGGGSVLWRLCEKWKNENKKIAVIETGSLLLPTHALNLPTFDHQRLTRYLRNPKYSRSRGEDWPQYSGATQFFALGGQTIHWGTACRRLHAEDFKDWPISLKDLNPYYNIAERVMNVTRQYTKDSRLQDILLERLRLAGMDDATDLTLATDIDVTKYGKVHSNVFFSSINFFALALNTKPFDLAVNTMATEIIHDNEKVYGLKVMTKDKKSYVLSAENIVLSGSTFENPRLLLNSKVKGEAIGKYLINHSFVVAEGTTERAQFPEVLGVAGIVLPRTEDQLFQIQVHGTDPFEYYWYHFKERPLKEELKFSLLGFGNVEPRCDNQVFLSEKEVDEYGVRKLDVQFSYSERDYEIIQQMAVTISDAANAMKLQLPTPPCLMAPGVDRHEAGTCRMGTDPATSVTNPFGQVHGMKGLYVADNSVVPASGAANPVLTIVALAVRTADWIGSKFS